MEKEFDSIGVIYESQTINDHTILNPISMARCCSIDEMNYNVEFLGKIGSAFEGNFEDEHISIGFVTKFDELIKKYPELDVYYSRTEIINEESEVVKVLAERPERESVYEMIQRRKDGRSMFIGDYCYRTSVLRKKGGFYDLPYAWGSDAITAYMMAGQKGIANTKEVGFQYRVNSQTISSSPSNIDGKIMAIMKERNWFLHFYETTPADKSDLELYQSLKGDNDGYFERMASGDLIRDISFHPVKSSFKWLHNRKKYGISFSFVLKCMVYGIFKM